MPATPLTLGVNIDHVATLRQARGTPYPHPAEAVAIVEQAGADSITVHLREDRRHIQDSDLVAIKEVMQTHMNLECAVTQEMLNIAVATSPSDVCLVPEKREELTTEGGLDVAGQLDKVRDACSQLAEAGIRTSLFIDPEPAQLDAAGVTQEMLNIAVATSPSDVCLVPEKREELTTEGGLDVAGQLDKVRDACSQLAEAGIRTSLFIDPEPAQLDAAVASGAPVVELHTGSYADAEGGQQKKEFERIVNAARYGRDLGLVINAGHGLHYGNVTAIAEIDQIVELNIGHAIIARAVFEGLRMAVTLP